jgi:hypothetical protein
MSRTTPYEVDRLVQVLIRSMLLPSGDYPYRRALDDITLQSIRRLHASYLNLLSDSLFSVSNLTDYPADENQ